MKVINFIIANWSIITSIIGFICLMSRIAVSSKLLPANIRGIITVYEPKVTAVINEASSYVKLSTTDRKKYVFTELKNYFKSENISVSDSELNLIIEFVYNRGWVK